MKNFFKYLFGSKSPPPIKRSYDIAKASRHFDNHFLYADNSDADNLISQSLEKVRNRCRYEVRNNSYAEGIVETLANDCIGTGPRLQLNSSSIEFNRQAELRWLEYGSLCDLGGRMEIADLLRLDIRQLCESGESFTVISADPDRRGGIFTKILAIESDRINSPLSNLLDDTIRQGIEVDAYGRPLFYYVQQQHPGSSTTLGGYDQYDKIPAAQMIHLARIGRPGQTRAMPWLQPALPLFADLRSFTLATVKAANRAAGFSAIMKTDGHLGTTDDVDALETIDIEIDQMMTLPSGWEMQQFKAEHPASTYQEFKHEILNEIGRCLNMPYNVTAANSSSYNYASGRLDWQVYYRAIVTIQSWIARIKLNRILRAWLNEAVLIPGYLPPPPPDLDINTSIVSWYWPGTEHVDPVKEATAEKIRLESGTLTYAAAYARQGKDWELELEQRARENEKIKMLGLSIGVPNNDSQKESNEPDPEEEEKADGQPAVKPRRSYS